MKEKGSENGLGHRSCDRQEPGEHEGPEKGWCGWHRGEARARTCRVLEVGGTVDVA